MRNISFSILLLILWTGSMLSCGNKNMADRYKNIPDINLPLKLQCHQFPRVHDVENFTTIPPVNLFHDSSVYYGKIIRDDFMVVIKNRSEIQSPVLYTLNKNGDKIDSLVLFDRTCFIGTDSDYLPWIQITDGLMIIRSDTSINTSIFDADDPRTKDFEMGSKTDTTITVAVFQISNDGKVIKTK